MLLLENEIIRKWHDLRHGATKSTAELCLLGRPGAALISAAQLGLRRSRCSGLARTPTRHGRTLLVAFGATSPVQCSTSSLGMQPIACSDAVETSLHLTRAPRQPAHPMVPTTLTSTRFDLPPNYCNLRAMSHTASGTRIF
ncbi:hypothetical protein K458DRAFT_182541 [Lentithecium fluviatile CBS 122367]|uniref:Uncharacterized protein n=1 Tax=Lentithecium fluviatile CBS 122367 TaxID=1168545 RepID=A0A6G1IEM4_9PLEO|nr:hypothetical protein K458DRAFT_182541 [Lentithecium fluviatile CBS 122367]